MSTEKKERRTEKAICHRGRGKHSKEIDWEGEMSAIESLYADLTRRIIESAIEVHRILGPGFLEAVYEEALAHEFDLRGIPYKRQVTCQIGYKGIIAGEHRLDFLVDDKVVLELKAVKDFEDVHIAITLSYMRATKKRVGLLINFNKVRLADGIKRLQN